MGYADDPPMRGMTIDDELARYIRLAMTEPVIRTRAELHEPPDERLPYRCIHVRQLGMGWHTLVGMN